MRIAVLTISDSVAKGQREDLSGPAVVAACRGLGWEVTSTLRVSDDPANIREQLRAQKDKVFAICPIVGGKSLKGPSDKMLTQLGYQSTALSVAKLYADFTGTFVIDPADKSQAAAISALGMKVAILPAVMKTRGQKRKLARSFLNL